ncbi:hypothetical protein GOB86_15140 [Acetobacter lambici]|uniref:Uncharacterized protein n=1 Tax=Acetobacter lambici TaxID=1332824 RepID=A0ABT1F4L7_9PROT|nr:hypothetical protein [Acetobacter lambici]MCP1244187.1 hypothetical protein [Acetobacter lambici]MCP1260167.1 hypothetical protein [Acetobacter lambici]NHO58338.1 hypothetical protein [Acetobacter lambici]
MMDILDLSKKVWCWIKWPFYIVAGILIFLIVTQLVECFGADASNKFAGIFTPLIVAAVTIYLSRRQHNIADAQRAVAEESKTIAAANRDIAERKLKLELFDKRYAVYKASLEFAVFTSDMSASIRSYMEQFNVEYNDGLINQTYSIDEKEIEKYNECKKYFHKIEKDFDELKGRSYCVIVQAKFLFDENSFKYFDNLHDLSFSLGNRKIELIKRQILQKNFYINEDRKRYDIPMIAIQDDILKIINDEMPEKMKQYLDISHI